MKLSFAFSPCPNDTFMFEAIANKRIDLRGLDFEITLDDVEQLNKSTANQIYDITKLSYNAYARVIEEYQLLKHGSALGRGCGPLLIAGKESDLQKLKDFTIAVPGFNTTAYFLLNHAFPQASHCTEVLFSEIEQAVSSGAFDAGVIIHENRFTYKDKGLIKLADLGEIWERTTGFPIPLGAIAVKRNLPEAIKKTVSKIISESIEYAFLNPDISMPYVRCHAQEMDDTVMKQHISLYVNEDSRMISDDGINAIYFLLRKKLGIHRFADQVKSIFV